MGEKSCLNIWKSENIWVEISYSTIWVLFVAQAVYSAVKRAQIALLFDLAMIIGCAVVLGIWLEIEWLT